MKEGCRVYRRRWLTLLLFVLASACNAAHWLQFAIIANVVTRYYGVSNVMVNWTSMVYMAAYIPLVFPASWLLDKKGLRVTLIAGAAMMTAGAWLKVLAAARDGFYIAFLGQSLVGAAQIFILGVPARLAAVWFGPGQVSTACSIGVFGNQVGIALGFLFPPAVVKNHDNLEDVGRDLTTLYYSMAAAPTVVFVLILLLLEKAPPTPPSLAQTHLHPPAPYLRQLQSLAANRSFTLLLLSYGATIGVFYAVGTLLNQTVLLHFEGAEEDAGRVGLVMVVAGIFGSVAGGVVLDRTHRFKETTLLVCILSLAGMLAFTFTLSCGSITLVYSTGAFLGFFMTGYLGVGYEFAAELTYPVPEGTSSGLLNAASELLGVALTLGAGESLARLGDRVTNLALCGVLLLASGAAACVQGSQLRRHSASCKPAPVPEQEGLTAS